MILIISRIFPLGYFHASIPPDMEEFIKNSVWSDLLKTNLVKELRFDAYGDIILWDAYKNEKSPYGWQIAYSHCPGESGENKLENLRAVNIKNFGRNNCYCAVSLEEVTSGEEMLNKNNRRKSGLR